MFFRLLLIIFLIYIIVGFFKRLFASPKSPSSQYQNSDFSEQKEGEVTIKDKGSNKQKINKAEGDYVDFEDV